MSRWNLCPPLFLVAVLSLGFLPPGYSVLANVPYRPLCDNYCAHSTEGSTYESAIPELLPNISVPLGLKGIVNSMLRRSPTFRRQCDVLNNAGNVRIDLRVVVSNTQLYKARSIVQRQEDGYIIPDALRCPRRLHRSHRSRVRACRRAGRRG
jgi:hypothetical protein